MAFTKFASFEVSEVLEVKGSATKQRTASLDKVSDFANYRTGDGYLYARIKAQSSRVNKNHDGWPSIELAGGPEVWEKMASQRESSLGTFVADASSEHKYGYSTFVGKPIFLDHNNSDPGRARGVIVDSKLHILDSKTASEGDEYWSSSDADEEHLPPTEIELLLEIDAESFPKFAEAVVKGAENPDEGIDGFSMGCDVEYSKCSHCGHKASSPDEYCQHIKMKGAEHDYTSSTGKRTSKKSYENCYGINYFEISGVFDPADETALTQEVITEQPHTSRTAGPYMTPTREQILERAKALMATNPHVTEAEAMTDAEGDLQGRFNVAPDQIAGDDGLVPDHIKVKDTMALPPEFPSLPQSLPQGQRLQGSYLASKTADNPLPQDDHVKAPEDVDTLREEKVCPVCGSDMDSEKCEVCGYEEPPEQFQNPDLTQAENVDSTGEADGQVDIPNEDPNAAPPGGGEGSYLDARKAQPTARVNNEMNTREAANSNGDEPTKETVTSDQTKPVTSTFRTAQDMIQATRKRNQENKMADSTHVAADPADPSGKAKKRVDVEGVGGVDQASAEEASRADKQVNVEGKGGVIQDSNADASAPDSKESLPTAGKDSDDSGFNKEKTTDDSGKTKTFDNSNEPGSAVTDKAFPTSAKKGTDPADPVGKAGERIDVETPPHDRVGPDTDQWTGTGGNGVTRQQDPVTKKVDPNIDVKKSGLISLAALKLADTEVALGLISEDDKYNRLTELAELSEEEVAAEQRALSKVKTANFRKNAATEPQGVGRVPSFSRVASKVDNTKEAQVVDNAMLDSALFR